jgi:signal transduction histidine kinase
MFLKSFDEFTKEIKEQKDEVFGNPFVWHNDFKIPNGVHAYGRRYNPFGPDNYPAEIEKIRQMTDIRDNAIWLAATKGEKMDLAAADKNIRIESEVAANARHAHYDRDRIFQVLTNLLNNAIKFTPEGGRIRVSAKTQGEMLRLEVTDSGCGIPESEMTHVFDRFWQAKHRQYLGTGLGLYIAKNIVEAHGGRIGLESRVGQGSTFYLMLPVRHIGCSSLET